MCDECSELIEYPTYVDDKGIEWDSREDYEINKVLAYLAARERRNVFADDEVLYAN